ncbi:MAG: hypothetical protein KIT22_08490 [Verrucomicrobiae bacterium]|nr:hypothetical protein [Verrucomicrobiae bacterium]
MASINPSHLLDQADRLASLPAAGAPKQADLRRAISNAYYAVFHATMAVVADQLIGATRRGSIEYGLAYRFASHKALKPVFDSHLGNFP